MPSIWEKYQKIVEIDSNSKIKTYKAKIEPIIKEIIPEDKKEYYRILKKLEKIKEKYKIIEMIEEENKIYLVINKDDELISKINKLLITDESNIQKEGKIKDHGSPITKSEILNLLRMEQSMCKMTFEKKKNGKSESISGSGFFCEIGGNFPIKYALFTNNHILDESNLEIGKTIKFKYFESKFLSNSNNIVEKSIKLTSNRKICTNEELDYTCIEIFESDGITKFFKIEPYIISNQSKASEIFKENDIFILQFLKENEISFSNGNIMHINKNDIYHRASTENGSSGSPIIKRDQNSNENYIIGLHKETIKDGNKVLYNRGTTFGSILENIKEQINEIDCIYIPDKDKKEIYLIHDYNLDLSEWKHEDNKKKYSEAKEMNKNIFENNIELYINDKKVDFNYKYKFNDSKEIKVKFKFNKILTNMSYMFYGCSSLKSINFSSFKTNKVNIMKGMFKNCISLKFLGLSSFNTSNVNDMSYMFNNCYSLENIDLSNFNTNKVSNMNVMFQNCFALKSLDLSSFNTSNVNNMSYMFFGCSSLKSIYLSSSFDTSNVNNMSYMFLGCSSLKSLDLSLFNTINVNNMTYMMSNCTSLKSLDLSSFNTSNVYDMSYMFNNCSSLKSLNIKSFNTSKVNNMSYMFNFCSSLENIDLSSFNTSNVNNMSYMFNNCSSLKSLNLQSFNTNNVNDMSYMFNFCSSLENIDLSFFNTYNVNNMCFMFNNCSSLKSLDLSTFNTSNVKDMSNMFNFCSSLKLLNLTLFNTSNVNNMASIFESCFLLKKENIIINNKNDNIIKKL